MYDDKDIVRWITVRGNHIPILIGQTKSQAINAFLSEKAKNKTISELKEELAQPFDEELNSIPITPITETAINKIPIICVPGYTQEECRYIAEQHKELLKYARDNNDNKEVAFVFNKDFSIKIYAKGEENTLDFDYALSGKGSDMIILHNHPRNKSFSKMDLIEFVGNEQIKTLTIVKNNGGVEVITKDNTYTTQKAMNLLRRSVKKYSKNLDKAVSHFLLNNGGIITWIKE